MNIVFLGPPGSGKGTQAKRLAETQGLTHLSTGDIFRETIQSGSALAQKIKTYVDKGSLVPDDVVSETVFEKLKSIQSGNGFLLDGYPRTLNQARAFDDFLASTGIALNAIILIDVESSVLVKRLSARRTCPSCKEVYNLITRPPKEPNKCDLNGDSLIQRPDDREEVIQERLKVYEKETAPILERVKDRKIFHRVNGDQDIDRVFAEIVSFLQESTRS